MSRAIARLPETEGGLMRSLAELNILLRARIPLPEGLRLATEDYQQGWRLALSTEPSGLEEKVLSCGWNFIKLPGESVKSGVGETSQQAIACALRHTLRRASKLSNAMTFENISLARYPWFILATVRAYSYRIQQGVELPVLEEDETPPPRFPRKRFPHEPALLYPQYFGGNMAMLKEMLILSETTLERTQ
jgi:hypothetical protein